MYYVYCGNGCAYSNEMYHGRVANALNSARRQGSKYIQKIKTDWGDRYFYTQQELDAYLHKAKRGVSDRVGITAKNKYRQAQEHTQRARNYLEGSRRASANSGFKRTERNRLNNALDVYNRRLDQERTAKNAYDNSLIGRFDHFIENASATIDDLKKGASDFIAQGRAKVQSLISSAKTRVSELLSSANAMARKYYNKGKQMLTELFDKIKTKYRMATGKQQYEKSAGPKQREVQGPPSKSREQIDQDFWEMQRKKKQNQLGALARASGGR